MKDNFDLKTELKKLPASPGVYLMYGKHDEIIYVGKAIILKNRVKQYFQNTRNHSAKIARMVEQIQYFEYIITASELEALVLENNLIKEHRPKYNTMLKDDKTYPFIKITVGEAFPRIYLTRKLKKDKAKYFGPYTNVKGVREIVEMLRKVFELRNCTRNLPKDIGKERPCLMYHIKQCQAPCQGYISKEAYALQVQKCIDFLNGKDKEILSELKHKMSEAAQNLDFEEAARLRDLIQSIENLGKGQTITRYDGEDRDFIAMAREERDCVLQVFFIRNGKMIGRDHFYMNIDIEESNAQILNSFITQFYSGTPFIPKEIMMEEKIEDLELIEEWLTTRRGNKVSLHIPQKGVKEGLLSLAKENAMNILLQNKDRMKREYLRTQGVCQKLATRLGLSSAHRIEAFDISNISGYLSVGSMVVFEGGRPKKNDYRKFKIKTIVGADDYHSLEEVLTRRFFRGLDDSTASKGFERLPDLILMDGGKGQVKIAKEVIEKFSLDIPICGMVKDDHHQTRALFYEGEEHSFEDEPEIFNLITRVQDEAHRFAIEYHRLLRSKEQVKSVLDEIEGIGPKRRKALLLAFGSVENISQASEEALVKVEGMNQKIAQKVIEFFRDR